MDSRRWPYFAAAAFVGAAIALFAYRFVVLPITWTSNKSFLFPGIAVGLAFGARSLLRDREPKQWPPLPLVIAAGLAGAGIAAALAFTMVPPISRLRLETRKFPGFSIDLPAGETKDKPSSYTAGSVHVLDVGGTEAVVGVDWEPGGRLEADQLTMLGRALSGSPTPGKVETKTEGGVTIDTLTVNTDKAPLRMSVIPCGTRHVIVTSGGSEAQQLQERIVSTFRCEPDAAQEASAAKVKVRLDLPGWWKAAEQGVQIQLTDGQSIVILQPAGTSTGSLKELLAQAFTASGGKIAMHSQRPDGLLPFDLLFGTEHSVGLAKQIMCPGSSTFLMLLAPDQASADKWVPNVESPHCLEANEPEQQWPAKQ